MRWTRGTVGAPQRWGWVLAAESCGQEGCRCGFQLRVRLCAFPGASRACGCPCRAASCVVLGGAVVVSWFVRLPNFWAGAYPWGERQKPYLLVGKNEAAEGSCCVHHSP